MRRRKVVLIVCFSLLSWAVATYFLFVFRPSTNKDEDGHIRSPRFKYEQGLLTLETQIKNAMNNNKLLLQSMKNELNKSQNQILLNKIKNVINKEDISDHQPVLNNLNINNSSYQEHNKFSSFKLDSEDVKTVLTEGPDVLLSKQTAELRKIAERKLPNGKPVIAVLVFSCNRVTVARCLDQLISRRPSKEQFPIIVSQDCSHEATTDVIRSYGDQLTLITQPDQSDIPVPPKEKKFKGYFKIARHYGWALNQTFKAFGFEQAIIVEDDLDIAVDFFEYFLGTYWLLNKDKTLWCVSAWNDNGKKGLIDESQSQLLYRTDFFPGLGWMLTASIWNEISVKWPNSYWDDWIRQPEQRLDRACIRPELPRSKTFGKVGVSNGLFFEKHLKYIELNEKFVSFSHLNLSYLLKDNYDVNFVKEVYESRVVSYQELRNGAIFSDGPVRIHYHTKDQFKKTAKMLGLMDDFRSGVPRTAYRGVVSFFYKGRRVYLAPNANWKNYDPTWS